MGPSAHVTEFRTTPKVVFSSNEAAATLRTMPLPVRMSFVTLDTHGARPIFHVSRFAEMFIETLLDLRSRGRIKLHGFLVLPDHVYLLLNPENLSLEETIDLIKTSFADQIQTRHVVWEPGFTAHPIRTLHHLEVLRTHIHELPVRANLTATPELYPYSSAYRRPQSAAS